MVHVSLIIPVFNAETYLESCITSLLQQTFSHCEFIFVNDGSTDGSKSVLEYFQQKDKRIVLINQENLGVSAARNKGISKAKGKYIGFVDSDDCVLDIYLEELYNLINRPNVEMSICGYEGSSKRFLNEGEICLNTENECSILKYRHYRCIPSWRPIKFAKTFGQPIYEAIS